MYTYASTVLTLLANLTFLCWLTYSRFSHVGKVCSGDYLIQPVTKDNLDVSYLGMEGNYFLFYALANWMLFVVIFTLINVQAFCTNLKRDHKQRDM